MDLVISPWFVKLVTEVCIRIHPPTSMSNGRKKGKGSLKPKQTTKKRGFGNSHTLR